MPTFGAKWCYRRGWTPLARAGFWSPTRPMAAKKHLDSCIACREEVAGAVRRQQGGNDSAFGALSGLTTQSLGAAVAHSNVSIGSLQLSARDCGWLADSHSNVCFYMSCADGNTGDALALKQRLAGLAMVLAQARRRLLDSTTSRGTARLTSWSSSPSPCWRAPSAWSTRSRRRAQPSSTPRRPSARAE
jgi:hypothetical protein